MEAIGAGKSPALARIVEAAHSIDTRSPDGVLAMRAIMMAVAEVRLSDRPRVIDQAPRVPNQTLLLYCPTQGGWQTGEWNAEKQDWVSTLNRQPLHPTHWAEVPDGPAKPVL